MTEAEYENENNGFRPRKANCRIEQELTEKRRKSLLICDLAFGIFLGHRFTALVSDKIELRRSRWNLRGLLTCHHLPPM